MDALLQHSVVITNNWTGFVLRGWAWGVPAARGGLLKWFLCGQHPFLEGQQLLEEGVIGANLLQPQITIFLLPLTIPSARCRVIPFALMRKAKTREALLETPAMQCTSTFVLCSY